MLRYVICELTIARAIGNVTTVLTLIKIEKEGPILKLKNETIVERMWCLILYTIVVLRHLTITNQSAFFNQVNDLFDATSSLKLPVAIQIE